MLKLASALLLCAALATAQQSNNEKHKPAQTPPMRVNVLNVCALGEGEQKEMSAALARLPQHPSFGRDYEIARGHTTIEESSDWVRIRREFPRAMPLLAAQYSYSEGPKGARETTVFYSREAKDVMQVALEDQVSAGTSAAVIVAADTPVSHIRIERFGKPSLVLARCPDADQSAYEPLFRSASEIMAAYRARLKVKQIVPAELRKGTGEDGGHRPVRVKPMGRQGAPESKP